MRFAVLSLVLVLGLAPATQARRAEDCRMDLIPAQTISGCTAAIRLNPKDASAYIKRGTAWFNIDEPARALEDYNQAIRLDPGNAWAYFERGSAHKKLGNFGQAVRDWELWTKLEGASQIRWLKERMKASGHYAGAVDGIYNSETRTALMACMRDPYC